MMTRRTEVFPYSYFAEFYDLASQTLAEETWRHGILEALRSQRTVGKTVLDLGCGTGIGGRLMRELGLSRIFGVDGSLEMLRGAIPYYSELLCCDLRALPTNLDRFDFIVSGFDTLNYLDQAELEAVFCACHGFLRNHGSRLLFDYSSPAMLREHWRDLTYDQDISERRRLRWRHLYNGLEHTTTWITLFEGDNELWTESHVQYTMYAQQMSRLAQRAGLATETIRDVPGDSFNPSAHTHLYVFRSITA